MKKNTNKKLRSQSSMNTGSFANATLSTSMPKEGSVCDGRLVGSDSSITLIRIPSVSQVQYAAF